MKERMNLFIAFIISQLDLFANFKYFIRIPKKKTILSMAESIKDAYLHPRSNLHSKSSSSGCIVLALTLSTSIVACLCGILMILA